MRPNQPFALLLAILAAVAFGLLGGRASAVEQHDFDRQIAPLLIERCLSCHNTNDAAGGLDLTRRETAFGRGDSGEVIIVPRHADASYLIERIDLGEMPPKGKAPPISETELKLLTDWINAGAAWTDDRQLDPFERTTDSRAGYDWWSLQPVVRPAVPPIDDAWIRNPIDAFVLEKLRAHELEPAPQAEKRSLLRRLTFDLTGLPPSIEEIDRFLADESPDAYDQLVDQLLASPRYGERWGRHWLDVAHFADTHGFERDFRRDHAWPYRDYVINCFNEDKPYNEFLREQIAGDIIGPNDADKIIATGFLAAGPWDFVGNEENKDPQFRRQARADDLDDLVTTVITSTVGLTINCARCHDHKFDPISTEDYYRLTAIFAGVTRKDRDLPPPGDLTAARKALHEVNAKLAQFERTGVDLADIIGGGNGFGAGRRGHGIDVRTGRPTDKGATILTEAIANQFKPVEFAYVDGVFIPDGEAPVVVSSTGLQVEGLTNSNGKVWDHIKFGPSVSAQTTVADGIDYNAPEHSMLALHANKGITFDLNAIREGTGYRQMRFRSVAAYGGAEGKYSADVWIAVDGRMRLSKQGLNRAGEPLHVDLVLAPGDRFLTLVATDGGNDISHDQVFFGDPRLLPAGDNDSEQGLSDIEQQQIVQWREQREKLKAAVDAKTDPPKKIYAVVPGQVPAVHILRRGDTESAGREVGPGTLTCIQQLESKLADDRASDGDRRLALADWAANPANPLTRRVLVNRLWHYHFGQGIVDTPSDFGFHGGQPSHPELLDWLADEFLQTEWSIKQMHRLIVTSNTYRQSGRQLERGLEFDADNRLLWRKSPIRLEAEIVRDSILSASGKLNLEMGGPGYRDFEYVDLYAPIYRYIVADTPELWRRSVYRFTVRSVPNQFLEVLDCPNPSNFAPAREETTTALQSLTLLNDPFMLKQATYLAERIQQEAGQEVEAQVDYLYQLTLARKPSPVERASAVSFVEENSLFHLCRVMFNTNEFIYVD